MAVCWHRLGRLPGRWAWLVGVRTGCFRGPGRPGTAHAGAARWPAAVPANTAPFAPLPPALPPRLPATCQRRISVAAPSSAGSGSCMGRAPARRASWRAPGGPAARRAACSRSASAVPATCGWRWTHPRGQLGAAAPLLRSSCPANAKRRFHSDRGGPRSNEWVDFSCRMLLQIPAQIQTAAGGQRTTWKTRRCRRPGRRCSTAAHCVARRAKIQPTTCACPRVQRRRAQAPVHARCRSSAGAALPGFSLQGQGPNATKLANQRA